MCPCKVPSVLSVKRENRCGQIPLAEVPYESDCDLLVNLVESTKKSGKAWKITSCTSHQYSEPYICSDPLHQ